jgi:DNA-binding transcriptional LysR family regulator
VREEILSGCWLAHKRGTADLVLGAVEMPSDTLGPELAVQVLGDQRFVFCAAPHHPLSRLPTPLSDADLVRHRAVVVADSGLAGQRMSVGLLSGQPTITVASLHAKLEAMIHGLGGGFMPEWLVAPALVGGQLVQLPVARRERVIRLCAAWRHGPAPSMGKALQWWLAQLQRPVTRAALIGAAAPGAPEENQSPNVLHLEPEPPALRRHAEAPGDRKA